MKAKLIEAAKALGYLALIVGACAVALYARETQAADQPHYSAQDTLQRAQVGTASARLAPPVRVTFRPARSPGRTPAPTFDRLTCRENPAEPKTIICEARRGP